MLLISVFVDFYFSEPDVIEQKTIHIDLWFSLISIKVTVQPQQK